MILERVSLSGAWRETESVSCSPSSARRRSPASRRRWTGRYAACRCSARPGGSPAPETAARCPGCPCGSPMPISTMLEIVQPRVLLGEQHLVQHLRRRQVPDLARDAWRRRRRSPSGSPPGRRCRRCFRGGSCISTDLDAVAVRQLPQVFDRAVQLRRPASGPTAGGAVRQHCSRSFSRRGLERFVISSKDVPPPCEPGEHLPAPKGRLPQGAEHVRELLLGHGFQISHASSLIPRHAADVKAVGPVALGPERDLAVRVLRRLRQGESCSRRKSGCSGQKRVRHLPRSPPAGWCRWSRAACPPGLHIPRLAFSRIAVCTTGRAKRSSSLLIADLRLFPDDAKALSRGRPRARCQRRPPTPPGRNARPATAVSMACQVPSRSAPTSMRRQLVFMEVAGHDPALVPHGRGAAEALAAGGGADIQHLFPTPKVHGLGDEDRGVILDLEMRPPGKRRAAVRSPLPRSLKLPGSRHPGRAACDALGLQARPAGPPAWFQDRVGLDGDGCRGVVRAAGSASASSRPTRLSSRCTSHLGWL